MKLSKRINACRKDCLDDRSADEMTREAKQLEDALIALVNTPRGCSKYMSADGEQSIRSLFVTLHYRNDQGDVLKLETFPVDAVFPHKHNGADIYIEYSKKLATKTF